MDGKPCLLLDVYSYNGLVCQTPPADNDNGGSDRSVSIMVSVLGLSEPIAYTYSGLPLPL